MRILERQEGHDAFDDRYLLVMRRHENTQWRQRLRPENERQLLVLGEVPMRPELGNRQQE